MTPTHQHNCVGDAKEYADFVLRQKWFDLLNEGIQFADDTNIVDSELRSPFTYYLLKFIGSIQRL